MCAEFNRTVINDNAFKTSNDSQRPAENGTNNMEPGMHCDVFVWDLDVASTANACH